MADSVPQRVAVGAWHDRWRADARAACVRRCEAAAAAKGTAALDLRGVHMRELSASLLELQLGALTCDEATVRFMRRSDAEALGPIAGTTQLDVAALCEHLQAKRSSARQRLGRALHARWAHIVAQYHEGRRTYPLRTPTRPGGVRWMVFRLM